MILSPPRAEERIIKIKSLRRNKLYKNSPLSFDVFLIKKNSHHRQTFIFSLTMKEAIRLHRELGKRVTQ